MSSAQPKHARGPFRADQIRCGDPYELSDGHPILVAPTGGRGSSAVTRGAAALASDPAVDQSGIDTGFSPEPGTLRAPDVAIGNVPDAPGWVRGVPPLAVEYADTGQNEDDLALKIRDLLGAGTQHLWVVRLSGARRVEVHEPGKPMRMVLPGEELFAPGILRNPVAVEALYDPDASREAALRNLLQRPGDHGLEDVRVEGRLEGRLEQARAALRRALGARGLSLTPEHSHLIEACADLDLLEQSHERAITEPSADEALAPIIGPSTGRR